MSVMLCPCMLYVALLMYLFVLFVVCLTVFVNCLVKQLGDVFVCGCCFVINVMDVFSVGWRCSVYGLPKMCMLCL